MRWHPAWLLAPALLASAGCLATPRRYEFTAPKMGTTVGIVLYAPDETSARAAADAAFARIDQLNAILSDYEPQSEINRLTATAGSGRHVRVSEDLFAVLTRAQEIAQLTGGAFDITAGPAIRQWRRARRTGKLPDPAALRDALQATGYHHLKLDAQQHTALLEVPRMHLDVGGIAKGYTAQQVLKVLRAGGLNRSLVAMAGDISAGDPPPGQKGWKVELDAMIQPVAPPAGAGGAKPSPAAARPRQILLANAHVSTSGDAYQHVVIDGVRYSHIVDPRSGVGLTQPIGATVISRDAPAADALASALCVMGPEQGLPLIEKLPGTQAIVTRIGPDGSVERLESSGARRLQFVTP